MPWWSGSLFGGLATVWLLTPVLGPMLGLHVGEGHAAEAGGGLAENLRSLAANVLLFLPGAIAGGVAGWFVVRPVNRVLGFLFRGFNRAFDRATRAYGTFVGGCLRFSVVVLLLCLGLIGLTGYGFSRVPLGFIRMQDKGYLVTNIQLPDSASLERTLEVIDKVEKIALETPGVAHTLSLPGMSYVLNANSSSYSNVFVIFQPFHERRDDALGGDAVAEKIRVRVAREVPEARVLVFGAPPISGLGTSAGFKLMVEGIGDVDYDALQARADDLAAKGNRQPGLAGLFNGFRARTPQLYVDIDREKVRSMGVPLTEVFDALQGYLGSSYVNDFNRFGRTWQVNVQADAPFGTDADAVKQLKVRNADGDMVPLGAVAEVRDSSGPVQITRYNMYPTASVNGLPLPGTSTGEALATMERLSADLPRNMSTEWTEVSYLQKQAGELEQFRDLRNNPFSAFAVGVVLVFFVLAGLYESWSTRWAVILVVPMCLLSALCGLALYGMDVNIFVQVGFVVLVELVAKNAILIVQFALDQQAEGKSRFDAAVKAARERLRPILMTSFAFILGVFPLVIAEGAGAEMRRTLGTAVFYGMIGVTLFGLFLTPTFYFDVRRLTERDAPKATVAPGRPGVRPEQSLAATEGVAASGSRDGELVSSNALGG